MTATFEICGFFLFLRILRTKIPIFEIFGVFLEILRIFLTRLQGSSKTVRMFGCYDVDYGRVKMISVITEATERAIRRRIALENVVGYNAIIVTWATWRGLRA